MTESISPTQPQSNHPSQQSQSNIPSQRDHSLDPAGLSLVLFSLGQLGFQWRSTIPPPSPPNTAPTTPTPISSTTYTDNATSQMSQSNPLPSQISQSNHLSGVARVGLQALLAHPVTGFNAMNSKVCSVRRQ